MAGRPPKPTALKEVQGAYKKNPQRKNKKEPIPNGGIGPALTTLNAGERMIWDEIVEVACIGVLTNADRISLELLCKLIWEMRTNFEEMNASKLSRLTFLLSQFGMTPADRSKISVPQAAPKNSFSDL